MKTSKLRLIFKKKIFAYSCVSENPLTNVLVTWGCCPAVVCWKGAENQVSEPDVFASQQLKNVAAFTNFYMYTHTLLKTQKSIKVSIFSFPTNIVKQSYEKVCYKIIFINKQFII